MEFLERNLGQDHPNSSTAVVVGEFALSGLLRPSSCLPLAPFEALGEDERAWGEDERASGEDWR